MITVSVTTVANSVKDLSDRHDADVISWANNLLINIDVSLVILYNYDININLDHSWPSTSQH